MAQLLLVYPGRLPSMNDIIRVSRRNRYAAAKQKRDIQDELAALWHDCRGWHIRRHATVRVAFIERDGRRDDDNVFGGLKFIMDTLQEMGIIPDDGPKWVHVLPERFVDRQFPRIEVRIEEDEENGKERV